MTCPTGGFVWGNGPEIYFDLYLDLPAEERVLLVYLFYEGQHVPPGVSAADLALARMVGALGGVGALGFQDEGITCLGPHYEPLKETFFGQPSGDLPARLRSGIRRRLGTLSRPGRHTADYQR